MEKRAEYKVKASGNGGLRRVVFWRQARYDKGDEEFCEIDLDAWLTALEDQGRVTDVVPIDLGETVFVVARVEAYVPEGEDRE